MQRQSTRLSGNSSRVSRLKCTRGNFSTERGTCAECGQAIQVHRRVALPCVKTCDMEEEPVRPAILCSDRPLLWISSPCTMLWGDVTKAFKREGKCHLWRLKGKFIIFWLPVSHLMVDNDSFFPFEKAAESYGESMKGYMRLIDIRYCGNLKWRSP